MIIDIKKFNKDIVKSISSPIVVEGGKVFVNRLVHLFGLRSKVELSEFIGVSTGAIATWQTRNTMPYELVIRLHLATGISVEYLLFDELKGDLNVMQYLPDPTLQPNYANIKFNISKFRYSLTSPAHYDGGAVLIERLVTLFQLESKVDLADLCGINAGTLGTWHTRRSTPHELLCRIHLATGVSMHFLCFGKEWDDVLAMRNKNQPASTSRMDFVSSSDFHDVEIPSYLRTDGIAEVRTNYSIPEVTFFKSDIYSIDDGSKIKNGAYQSNAILWEHAGVSPNDALVIRYNQATYFINTEIKTVTKGLYLFAINDVHQIGELKQLPDGKVYFIDGEDKYQINQETTKVIGKVVSVLKNI
ncbi:helix-turn-helix domain-containing protein [Shewanella frigidimarina]|uniref:helix-turn-helix domain-containing protein n=1 Tax=Shewanella frigidimarina TaxID=56812 RepID=UPI003D79FD3F